MPPSPRSWTSIMLASMLCAAAGFAGTVPDTTAWHVTDSFNATCSYRCCDTKRNCSVADFYMGGKSSWPKSCDWNAVCSHQGTIGWSYGGTPSQSNSTLTVRSGCWKEWQNYWETKNQILPCGQQPKPDIPPAPPAPPRPSPPPPPPPATPQQVRDLLDQLNGLKEQIDVMTVDHTQLQMQWGALQSTVQQDKLTYAVLQAKVTAFQQTVYQAIKNEPTVPHPNHHIR